jgi:hypothetical protein
MLEGRRRRPKRRRRRRSERRRKRRLERRQRRRPGGRRPSRTWWWPNGPMRVKAPMMSGHRGSSPARVVQGLSLLLLAFIYLLLNEFCCKFMLNLCEQLNMICIMHKYDIIIYRYIYVCYDCM